MNPTDHHKELILLQKTKDFIRNHFTDPEPGHDFRHSYRVWKNCLLILKHEEGDPLICQLAALLHDIADPKFHGGDEDKGPEIASGFLLKSGASEDTINRVSFIIRNVSFAGNLNDFKPKNNELKIVMDADRLDAMGAIGIARAFSYGGYKKRPMYDPSVKIKKYHSIGEYRKSKAPTINHFYEKLLLLKDLMNTSTGKKLAEERHKFMEIFLEQFYKECGDENFPGFNY